MKKLPLIAATLLAIVGLSFAPPRPAAGRVLNLIYVDNSKYTGTASMSGDMIEAISRKADSVGRDANTSLLLFLSNGTTPQVAHTASDADKKIAKLYDSYSELPSSLVDKKHLYKALERENMPSFGEIHISFFVTEKYLGEDLMGENAGFLLRSLPKELRALANNDEGNVHVYIYFPKEAKSVKAESLRSFLNFGSSNPQFASKIHYHIQAI